jgi:hypothetical protein
MAALTPVLKEQWDRDGWCVVPGLIPPGELAAAQHAMHRHFPTPTEMAARGGAESGEWHTWDAPWPEFPFHSSRLNALVLHDRVVDLAEGLLGAADLASSSMPTTRTTCWSSLAIVPVSSRWSSSST